MDDQLKATDKWCAHAQCPHLKDNMKCIDCRKESIVEHETMADKGKKN